MTPKTEPVYIRGPYLSNRAMRRAGRMKPILVLAYVDLGTEEDPNVRLCRLPSGELRPMRKGPGYTRKMRKGRRGT